MKKIIILFAFLFLSYSAQAQALKGQSAIILCYETIDSKKMDTCSVQNYFYDFFKSMGAYLVDPGQARFLRKKYAPEDFSNKDLKGYDLLDAKLLILLKVNGVKQPVPIEGVPVVSYKANYEFTVIRISNAESIFYFQDSQVGVALDPGSSIKKAAKLFFHKKGSDLQNKLKKSLSGPKITDLWVYGLPNFREQRNIEDLVRQSNLATNVVSINMESSLSKWRIELREGKRAMDIATFLEERPKAFLQIQKLSDSMLQLVYNPKSKIKMAVYLEGKNGKKVPKWFRDGFLEMAADQLYTMNWIEPVFSKEESHLAKILVTSKKVKNRYQLQFFLRTKNGKKISSHMERTNEEGLVPSLGLGVKKVLKNFHSFLKRNPRRFSSLKMLIKGPPRPLLAEIEIFEKNKVFFAAQLESYRQKGIGNISLNKPLDWVGIKMRIPGLSEFGPEQKFQFTEKIQLKPYLSEKLLKSLKKPRTLRFEVLVNGQKGERFYQNSFSETLFFYPINAINWNNLNSYAAFINPSSSWAKQLITKAVTINKSEPSEALGLAAVIWNLIVEKGISYIPDPSGQYGSSDIDTVELPGQVFMKKTGDCDDLTALFASALEAAGIETRIITSPGHIFLAINSGLFSTAWPLVAKSKDDILDISGNLYLPIEATAIKGNFWEAIRKGMDEILNNKKKLEILNPRVAWAKYPSLLDETNEKINFEKGSNEPDWKDHYKYLTRSLSNDYYSQTRFYATQGDLKSAEKLLQKIKNPKKQSLARANIEFLKGSLSKAFKLYKNTSGEKATMNAFLAANALGEIKEAKEILPKIKSKKLLKHFGLAAEKVKQGRGSKLTKGPELVKQKLLLQIADILKNSKKIKNIKYSKDQNNSLGGKRGVDPSQAISVRFLIQW